MDVKQSHQTRAVHPSYFIQPLVRPAAPLVSKCAKFTPPDSHGIRRAVGIFQDTKSLEGLVHPTRFERVTSAF
ncbi:MAG: hypothetical protein OSB58_19285, partial [Alphaproteobacteria bacterium]|nr:hypothetical protein [Alphaproteobacteria bacterium]